MGRGELLGALLEHNRQWQLSTAIWGDSAGEAAQAAAEAMAARDGGTLPACSPGSGSTAYRLETPLDLAYRVRCDAPERLHFAAQGGLQALNRSPLALEVAQLEQAVVREWQGYHLVLAGGQLVADGSSAYWPLAAGALADEGIGATATASRREELAEAFVVCDDLDTTNFCHFVCDLLPKIALAGECRRRIPIVIEPPSQPFQRELLARVSERHGHPIVPLEPGLELAVGRLFYLRRATGIHPLLRCSGLAIQWLRDLLDARPAPAPEASVLYLGRRSRRRVLNEEPLIAALQRHTPKLEVVQQLGALPVRQQAELLGRHRLVVGPHGAGFTHLLFAGEAPQVALELMAEGNGSLAFALISSRLGIDHRIHVARSAASGNGPNYPDLEVDVEAVLELARQP
jgi:capsular polysaccharide biosynthesis protein